MSNWIPKCNEMLADILHRIPSSPFNKLKSENSGNIGQSFFSEMTVEEQCTVFEMGFPFISIFMINIVWEGHVFVTNISRQNGIRASNKRLQ